MQKIILSNFLLQVKDRTKNETLSYFLCPFVQILSAGISLGSSGQQGNIDRETEKIGSIYLQKKKYGSTQMIYQFSCNLLGSFVHPVSLSNE